MLGAFGSYEGEDVLGAFGSYEGEDLPSAVGSSCEVLLAKFRAMFAPALRIEAPTLVTVGFAALAYQQRIGHKTFEKVWFLSW